MTTPSLHRVPAGTPVVVGHRVLPMPRLDEGDRLLPVHRTGDLLTVPAAEYEIARLAAERADAAFRELALVSDDAITRFFEGFADRLADDAVWAGIAEANASDVDRAKVSGRSTTRLALRPDTRTDMTDGLRGWAKAPSRRGEVIERRDADTWTVERRRAALGVVAFVFEGRPNVFADGAGVLRNGNTSVMRIGSDALGTAVAIDEHALQPALYDAGLPGGAVTLVRSRSHASAHALFTMPQVRLAIARGSGSSVALLGSIAEQHGIPASLHGTGGGWLYVAEDAPVATACGAVAGSLDRKVCNTLNVLLVHAARAHDVASALLEPLARARLHVVAGFPVPEAWYERRIPVVRPEGQASEQQAEPMDVPDLGREWEWEGTPELSVALVDGDEEAIALVNAHSPRMVASIVTTDANRFDRFYRRVDAPYVGNGFTRWVDGQWAWGRPELGLTNWERGRLLGRSGILSGDDVFTVRDVFLDRTGEAPQRR